MTRATRSGFSSIGPCKRIVSIVFLVAVALAEVRQTAASSADNNSKALLLRGEEQLELGRTALDSQMLLAARESFQDCIRRYAEENRCSYGLGRADAYLNQAEANSHNDPAAKRWLDTAIEDAEKAVAGNPASPEAHALLSDLYRQKISGMVSGMRYGPKANAELAKAFQIDPNNATAYAVAGRKYLYAPAMFGGSLDKAIESFQKATSFAPQSDENFVWLAIAYRKKGDSTKYHEAIEHALELNPKNVFAHRVGAGTD